MHVIIDIDLDKLPEGAGASSLHLGLYAPLLRICNNERTHMDVEVGGVVVGNAVLMPSVQEMITEKAKAK